MARANELQEQLKDVKKLVPDMKEENALLTKDRDQLQAELDRQRILQKDLQSHLEELRSRTTDERRARAAAAFKVSENIAQEREGIVKQLDLLKAVNSKMLDERDAAKAAEVAAAAEILRNTNIHEGQGETIPSFGGGDDIEGGRAGRAHMAELMSRKDYEGALLHPPQTSDFGGGGSEYECDDEFFANPADSAQLESVNGISKDVIMRKERQKDIIVAAATPARLHSHLSRDSNVSLRDELACLGEATDDGTVDEDSHLEADGEEEEENHPEIRKRKIVRKGSVQRKANDQDCTQLASSTLVIHHQPRASDFVPNGHEIGQQYETTTTSGALTSYGESDSFQTHPSIPSSSPHYVTPLSQMKAAATSSSTDTAVSSSVMRSPERVFKLIFIGDSCVGKTSLVTRFCRDHFESDVRSTVGVDFHTRAVLVGEQSVCLQCWDTAGQERYRAITRQYFRKVDAVVVVYDVTAEKTYLNAREWMDSAADAVGGGAESDEGGGAPMLLLGNKLDLADDDLQRRVRKCEGLDLARRFGALFWEVSAADGRNVEAALIDLAHRLRETEDR